MTRPVPVVLVVAGGKLLAGALLAAVSWPVRRGLRAIDVATSMPFDQPPPVDTGRC
ncbi:hypothetical protein [uncultured Jatrophihabitans sp.]|uniref:hypothetical protein n=1 Tax=uncultured Jatrophihabitans sp. TaxID=1610747 RepID=UPI0035CC3A5C